MQQNYNKLYVIFIIINITRKEMKKEKENQIILAKEKDMDDPFFIWSIIAGGEFNPSPPPPLPPPAFWLVKNFT